MRKESFSAASDNIKLFFEKNNLMAYTTHDLSEIFNMFRNEWNIATYRNQFHFMKFLNESNILKLVKLKHIGTNSEKHIYVRPGTPNIYIAQTIKKDGYLSHYSALSYHRLTLQIPKTIYMSYDKYAERYPIEEISISQEAIDKAFSKPQRITSEVYRSEIDNTRFFFVQKKSFSVDVGVIVSEGIRVTDLERTLVDIIVRPNYSGGVFEVLEAYKNAKKEVNLKKLNQYLEDLDYIYPYHQLVGFYLQKAGIEQKLLKSFSDRISKFNFYLTYNMSNKKYDKMWKIYYPNGF